MHKQWHNAIININASQRHVTRTGATVVRVPATKLLQIVHKPNYYQKRQKTYAVAEKRQNGFDDVGQHSFHLLVAAFATRRYRHQRAMAILPVCILFNSDVI